MADNGHKPEGVLGTLPSTRTGRVRKPAAVKPASEPLRPTHTAPKPLGAPRGTELVTTSIRAAGELAQIGLTVGGRALKRTIDRLPRP